LKGQVFAIIVGGCTSSRVWQFLEDRFMSDQVEMVAEQEEAGKVEGAEMAPTAEPSANPAEAPATGDSPEMKAAPQVEPASVAETVATTETPEPEAADSEAAESEVVTTVAAEAAEAVEVAPEMEVAAAVAEADAPAETTADTPEETKPEAASEAGRAQEPAAAPESAAEAHTETENNRRVRVLSVGQEVTGTVKRVADFGAFVDIGVGRDGLIHISELSVRRVSKVTDVLAEGQEITAWIKKLDRERNRISLTLIDPNTKTIRDLEKGALVQGTVTRILPYGAFVDIGIGRDALLHVREMAEGYVAKPEDVVKVGETVEARIIELSRRRGRVDLSLKGLRPEPEPVQQAAPAKPEREVKPEPEPEPEPEDDYDEIEVLSPMELAFKRAMEAEGIELKSNGKKRNKRNRRDRNRSIQDEIIARTLASGQK
jgi:transcriptional accessory protein Tex/SPT6